MTSLCHTWNGENLTSKGKADPERDIKGKVRLELKCDSTFHMSDSTEGALETVTGTWGFSSDSVLVLSIPNDGELTRFKVRAWDDHSLTTYLMEIPEEDVIVTYSAE